MREIAGRDGVPLKYIIRANYLPDLIPKKNFLEDYVNKKNLIGEEFSIDAAEVHTLMLNLIDQNEEAESFIKLHEYERDIIKNWKAFKSHY